LTVSPGELAVPKIGAPAGHITNVVSASGSIAGVSAAFDVWPWGAARGARDPPETEATTPTPDRSTPVLIAANARRRRR
jgi:hypothetical protein